MRDKNSFRERRMGQFQHTKRKTSSSLLIAILGQLQILIARKYFLVDSFNKNRCIIRPVLTGNVLMLLDSGFFLSLVRQD